MGRWAAQSGAQSGPQLGTLLAILEGHTDRVWSASFSPDGSRIVTASSDFTARVWRMWPSTQALIDYARECCVFRELTTEERAQFGLPPE